MMCSSNWTTVTFSLAEKGSKNSDAIIPPHFTILVNERSRQVKISPSTKLDRTRKLWVRAARPL